MRKIPINIQLNNSLRNSDSFKGFYDELKSNPQDYPQLLKDEENKINFINHCKWVNYLRQRD